MTTLKNFALDNKVALITGGGNGIGQMMAESLAKAGAFVWLMNRSAASDCVNHIKKNGGHADYVCADVTDNIALEKQLLHIYKKSKNIDILVNAAGINVRIPAEQMTLSAWQKTIDVNLTAPYQLSQLVAKQMKKQGWGRIINIASLQSSRAFDNSIAYGASKGGIVQLTRALAQAYSRDGILVNAIAPGFFHTKLTDVLFQDKTSAQKMADKTMIKRNGLAQDLFGISVFLASDANTYITGQTIALDGGFSAQ